MQRPVLAIALGALIVACGHGSESTTALSCTTGRACFAAGAASYDGAEPSAEATGEDLAIATRYFVRACELGYDRGCHTAGNMYRLGRGVDKDLLRARRYYESVCSDSYPEACHNLGLVDRELAAASQ